MTKNLLVFALFIRLKRPVPEYTEMEIERNLIGICDAEANTSLFIERRSKWTDDRY